MNFNTTVKAGGDSVSAANNNAMRLDIILNAGQNVTTTGTGSAYIATLDAQLVGGDLVAGVKVRVKWSADSVAGATLRIDDSGGTLLAAKAIKKGGGTVGIGTGDLKNGQESELCYDGTYWQLLTPTALSSRFGGTGADGALTIASGTTNINLDQLYNYSSVNISAGATLSTAGNSGCMYINVQGDFVNAGTVDLDGKGEAGGAAVALSSVGATAGNNGTSIQQLPFPQGANVGLNGGEWNYTTASVGTPTKNTTGGRGGCAMRNGGTGKTQGGEGGCSLLNNSNGTGNNTWSGAASTVYANPQNPLETGANAIRTYSTAPLGAISSSYNSPWDYWQHCGIRIFCTGAGGASGGTAVDATGGGTATSGTGGRGGGGIKMDVGGAFNNTGTIKCSGAAGGNASQTVSAGSAGGGGGGGGGMGDILANSITSSGTLTSNGGAAGTGASSGGSNSTSDGTAGTAGAINVGTNVTRV